MKRILLILLMLSTIVQASYTGGRRYGQGNELEDFLFHQNDPDSYFGFDATDAFGLWLGGVQIIDASSTALSFGVPVTISSFNTDLITGDTNGQTIDLRVNNSIEWGDNSEIFGLLFSTDTITWSAGSTGATTIDANSYTLTNLDVLGTGADPADAGAIRLSNGEVIAWEDATETTLTHVDNTGLAVNLNMEAATITEGGNDVFNSTEVPGGELGGTFASFTIDDGVAVSNWNLTTPTITTSATVTDDTYIGISGSDERIVFDAAGDITFLDTEVGFGTDNPAADVELVDEGSFAQFFVTTYSDNDAQTSIVAHRKAGGTLAIPTTVTNNELIGEIQARAYDGDSFEHGAGIQFEMDGDVSDGDTPGRIVLRTTPDGSGSPIDRQIVRNDGHFEFINTTIVYDVNNISADVVSFNTYGVHIINSSGAGITGTLADGSHIGQSVKFVCKVAGNNIDITVANHITSNPEVIRLDTAGEWVEFVWDGTDQVEVDGNGQTYP